MKWWDDLTFLNVEFWANFLALLFNFHQEALHFQTLNIYCLFNPKPSVGLPLSLMSTLTSLFNSLGTSLILNSLHFFLILQLIFYQSFLFHFPCSFPIKMAQYYHSDFCQFHYKFCDVPSGNMEDGTWKMETWFAAYIYYLEHFHWLGKSAMFSELKGSLICHLCLPNFMM